MLVDTHCHLHDHDFPLDQAEAYQAAQENGVKQMLVVGTDQVSSEQALAFAEQYDGVFATVGVHPHHAKDGIDFLQNVNWQHPKLVAVGEIGLDYHHDFSPRPIQRSVFQSQIELALKHDLPIIFHVREAFDDFWPIVDQFTIPKAVVHSFSDNINNLDLILAKNWLVGINGLVTFTRDPEQIEAFEHVPLEGMLLETDAPYMTPKPFRGQPNQPAFVRQVAEFIAGQRGLTTEKVAAVTTDNARCLFNLP